MVTSHETDDSAVCRMRTGNGYPSPLRVIAARPPPLLTGSWRVCEALLFGNHRREQRGPQTRRAVTSLRGTATRQIADCIRFDGPF